MQGPIPESSRPRTAELKGLPTDFTEIPFPGLCVFTRRHFRVIRVSRVCLLLVFPLFGICRSSVSERFHLGVQPFPLLHPLREFSLKAVVFLHGGTEKLVIPVKLLGG